MSLSAHISKVETIAGGSGDTALIGSPQPTLVIEKSSILITFSIMDICESYQILRGYLR